MSIQRYRALLESNNETIAYLETDTLGYNGIDIEYLSTIYQDIYKKPTRIAWVGNLSNQLDSANLYQKVWGNNAKIMCPRYARFSLASKYIVNHTKQIYIDYSAYYSHNVSRRFELFNETECVPCVDALPILTNIGYGLSCNELCADKNYLDAKGSWAWDEISIEDAAPIGYSEVMYTFSSDTIFY